MFLTADGESGKAGGNETIRVDERGRLRIKVPAALVDRSARICTSPHLWRSITAVMSGPIGSANARRCATTSSTSPSVAAGIGRLLDRRRGRARA